MFPGMGGRGLNPKKMNQMMKQLGIDVKDIPDVDEVIVRTRTKEYVLRPAEVSVMTAQGQKTWQVTGDVTERPRSPLPDAARGAPEARGAAAPQAPAPLFTEEDVDLVAAQAGVSKDAARAALVAANGETAAAILTLIEK